MIGRKQVNDIVKAVKLLQGSDRVWKEIVMEDYPFPSVRCNPSGILSLARSVKSYKAISIKKDNGDVRIDVWTSGVCFFAEASMEVMAYCASSLGVMEVKNERE